MPPKSLKKDHNPQNRILVLGEINGENVNEIIHDIYEINKEDKNKPNPEPIELIINSEGGDIYTGLGLVDVIINSKTPIHTICHGSAMSMAIIIFSVGHVRKSSANATFMYHEGWYESTGDMQYQQQELKEMNRIQIVCDKIFLSRTKFTQKQLQTIRDKRSDYYFDVNEAKKYNLVDEIL